MNWCRCSRRWPATPHLGPHRLVVEHFRREVAVAPPEQQPTERQALAGGTQAARRRRRADPTADSRDDRGGVAGRNGGPRVQHGLQGRRFDIGPTDIPRKKEVLSVQVYGTHGRIATLGAGGRRIPPAVAASGPSIALGSAAMCFEAYRPCVNEARDLSRRRPGACRSTGAARPRNTTEDRSAHHVFRFRSERPLRRRASAGLAVLL